MASRRLISTSARCLLGGRVGELAGLDDRADLFVSEGHHPSRRPERVVGTHFDVGRGRRVRLPRRGIEPIAFEPADGVVGRVGRRLPRAQCEAERQEATTRGVALVEILPALVPVVRAVGAHPEGRADVLQVVLHHGPAVFRHERIEGVAGFQSVRLVQAPNTRSARSSRRCSCGTMSLGSSGRVPS